LISSLCLSLPSKSLDTKIHKLVKIVIQKRELSYLKPKQAISIREERYPFKLSPPTKQQRGAENCSCRSNLISSEVKDMRVRSNSLTLFIKD